MALSPPVIVPGLAWQRMTHAYVAGIAPRSVAYMRAHWDHAKGFIDDAGLEAARLEERTRWVGAQQQAGLELISPSYVETEDVLRPLTAVAGAQVGSLTRTFETNTFHRRPAFSAPVAVDALRPWVDTVRPEGPWVLTLPSPYDAVVRSDVPDDETADSIAACLRDAAAYAVSLGALRVRFQEPSATYRGHELDVERLARLLDLATQGIHAESVVHFTQGDVLARPELVDAVPCAGIGLDVQTTSLPATSLLEGRQLHAGIVRGESSLVETPETAKAAFALADASGARLWAVTNGWDLEHVPFDVAVAKLRVLAAARAPEVLA